MKHTFLVILLLLISACTSAPVLVPTPATVSTPLPTPTHIPEPITGTIFWDANGSGLQDETSFIVPKFDIDDTPYFFELLEAQGTDLSLLIIDELITVPEPDIPGMKVCMGKVCTETDENGEFALFPEKFQTTYELTFEDPNIGDPEKEFRYINEWKGKVVIEAYEMDGVVVPEQHLNDTVIVGLDSGFSVIADEEIAIGLMQGFLTLPIQSSEKFSLGTYYDLDFGDQIQNWLGTKEVTGNNHHGIDYRCEEGTTVSAAASGIIEEVYWKEGYAGGWVVVIGHGIGTTAVEYDSDYAHIKDKLVGIGNEIYRGQSIGLTGIWGSYPHLHFGSFAFERDNEGKPNPLEGNLDISIDPYRDLLNSHDLNYWTVDNIPQFPLVEMVE